MTQVSVKVEYKALKVECVGSEELIQDWLPGFCSAIVALDVSEAAPVPVAPTDPKPGNPNRIKKSTVDFAVALGASTGAELALAAAASLHLSEGREDFKRAEILERMKSAKSFYKQTYSGNLSSILSTLVKKQQLSVPGNEVYALTHTTAEDIRSRVS